MAVRMRDKLAKRDVTPTTLVIDADTTIGANLANRELIVLRLMPRHAPYRRRYRETWLDLDTESQPALLEALLDGDDAMAISDRAETYEGPVKGRASRIGVIDGRASAATIDLVVSAAAPAGFTADPGDVFLSIVPTGEKGNVPAMMFRLDRGAKRFLISQLEQNITIENMYLDTSARRGALAHLLDRARAFLKRG